MLEKSNFEVSIIMMPNSEKIIKCKLIQPKIFMRADIFMMIAEFFMNLNTKVRDLQKDVMENIK